MPEENLEIVRQGYRDWSEGKVEATLSHLAPDFEYVTSGAVPGLRRSYRGHQGWRDFWDDYAQIWESLRVELDDVRDADDLVVALITQKARARQGLEVERRFGNVWTFRDGLVTRLVAYPDWNQALEAGGLSE